MHPLKRIWDAFIYSPLFSSELSFTSLYLQKVLLHGDQEILALLFLFCSLFIAIIGLLRGEVPISSMWLAVLPIVLNMLHV